MPAPPLVNIVIPLRSQRNEWLEQCVRSALTQSVPSLVTVVTSSATPARNKSVLERLSREHERLRCFERQPGACFADAINEGWRSARTPRIGLLLSDDWLEPEAVECCLALNADIVSSGEVGHAADGRRVLWQNPHTQAAFDALPTLERKASYLNHFFLFRRDPVLAVGGVDPTIGNVGPDDYDLPWTLLEHGASVAIVERGLYHYRDHDQERLTLRPQQDQLRDLRRLLAKHGVAPADADRLADMKARWYGVPVHFALENPDWYRETGSGIDRAALGDDLHALVGKVSAKLVRSQRLGRDAGQTRDRACYRLDFDDGRILKGRYVPAPAQAERLMSLMPLLQDLPLSRPLGRHGRALLEEWLDGIPLTQIPDDDRSSLEHYAELSGDLLGRLSRACGDDLEDARQPQSPESKLRKLERQLSALSSAERLTTEAADWLTGTATDNAPFELETGLVHLDLQPSNLLVADDELVLVDNESISLGSLDFALARVWYLWPMTREEQAAFLRGYTRHRNPISFVRHELFWAIITLAAGAELELSGGEQNSSAIAALNAITAGELPRPWLQEPSTHSSKASRSNAPIRVGLICDYLAIGGQERALLNLLKGFDATRFERFVYAFRGGDLAGEIQAMGVPLLLGSQRPPLSWMNHWGDIDVTEKAHWRRELAQALRRDQIDAALIFAWPDGVAAAREAGVDALIERLDGPALLEKIDDKSAFDRIVCQSETTRQHLSSRAAALSLDKARLELIYPGIDLERFDPSRFDKVEERRRLGFGADDLIVGYVGRLDPDKNIDRLMRAIAWSEWPVDGNQIKLLIMGPDAGALDDLKTLRKHLRLQERVIIADAVLDVAPVLAALDLFALMTSYEGIPNSVLEAMAMGLPIVATDVGSIHEVVERSGELVSGDDPKIFGKVIRDLLKRSDLLDKYGYNGRRLSRRFHLRYASARFEELIDEILAEKRPAAQLASIEPSEQQQ